MPKYELAIAVCDEQDLPSGHKRKKEGDILAVRPYPWNWGLREIDECLIIIVDSDLPMPEMKKLEVVQFKDGYDWYPEETDEILMNPPERIAKRRYSIPLENLKTLFVSDVDLVKVKDNGVIYQPMKSDVQLVQKFDGKDGNYLLDKTEVDTDTISIGSDEEFTMDVKSNVNLIWDKHLSAYFKFVK